MTPRRLPGDDVLAAYLAATGVLALATASAPGAALAAAHAGGVAVLAWLAGRWRAGESVTGTAGARRPGPSGPARHLLRFFRVFLPVALTPLLYTELETLGQLTSPGYLDAAVQGWEAALFGGQPSLTAARRWPGRWLSEALHAGYFSYYLVVPAAAVAAYRRGGEEALSRLTVTVALAFFVCYLCFAVFPVAGPRYEFPRIQGPPSEGFFFGLVHGVLEAGSAKGTAFPSSHVAAATAALLAVWREDRRWFWALVLPVVFLTLGTVYGRFHYAVDALAGLAVAFAAWGAAPRLHRWLGGGGARARSPRGVRSPEGDIPDGPAGRERPPPRVM